MLKSLLAAIVTWLLNRLTNRPETQVTERTYEAKAAEAKDLAKPDDAQSAVVDRL